MKKHISWAAIALGLLLAACSAPQGAQEGKAADRHGPDSTALAEEGRHAGFNPDIVSNKKMPQAMSLRDYLARVPGVVVEGYNVSIRGAGAPLFIIDGIQVGRSLRDAENMININDVDYVEVVKSPTELAMYGRLGGNGVIRIFTKRPEQ